MKRRYLCQSYVYLPGCQSETQRALSAVAPRFLDHPSRCGLLCLFFKDLFRCSRRYTDIFMYIFSIN